MSTTHMLIVPGTYHCIENIQKMLLRQWTQFDDVKPGLESACYVMHHAFTRNAYVESLRGPRIMWKQHFSSGPALFEGGRVWGACVKISEWFRQRRLMIRASWSAEVLAAEGDEDILVNREKGVHARKATEAFGTDRFWGFIELIYAFSGLLDNANDFAISCSCHPYERCKANDLLSDKGRCVMRGRRVAEIACGALDRCQLISQ